MLIDCHVHLNDYTEDPKRTLRQSAEALFTTMEQAGVAHAVILTSYRVTPHTYSKKAKVRQAHPLLVDDLAVDYPDVKFVICHLGNPWFQDTAEVLYKNDNVYADISGLTLGDFQYEFERYMLARVKDMISYMGDPGKQIMFGTDWPLVGMVKYVKFLEGLELSEEALDNIRWRTAARLFRIDTDRLKAPAAENPS